MPTIDSLHNSISSMEFSALLSFIRERRALRREPKPKIVKAKKASKAKSKKLPPILTANDALDRLKGQGQEQLLLKMLIARRKE